ncbi:MAG: alpha/beta fold hydrolase [Alphaproteobacteria bacterium]|nr:alpha/beta fold hydrolase [Alphaproteobacteria bacterium]
MAESTADFDPGLPDAITTSRRVPGAQNRPPKAIAPKPEPQNPPGRTAETPCAATRVLEAQPRSTHPGATAAPAPPIRQAESSSLADHYAYTSIDRAFRSNLARLTFGLSPAVLMEQSFDWLVHLATSPGKQLQLIEKGFRNTARFGMYAAQSIANPDTPPCITPSPHDRRFEGHAWQRWPYNLISQSFLLTQEWWHNATTAVNGVSERNEKRLSFTARQLLDVVSPSNFVLTNPEVAQATLEQGGRNLVQGFHNLLEDWQRTANGKPPVGAEQFVVGQNVAATPGKVVFQNRLIELIQYAPATDEVHAEPVLIVPAWIMKYYILDLSPQNSLVKYLVEHGHTVFMISWKNPTSEDRDLGMDEYRRLGILAAFDAISAILPERKVHAAGYCLGGTLLMIAAAAMGRAGDDRLASMTLFAAQGDFTEAGELMLFINESQIAYLENMMWDRGYLDTYQMAGAFQILRSKDLVWSRVVREYLLGGRQPMNDLMAWNADATRMPYRMHSEYLRRLFLNNDFAEGRFEVDGRPVWVTDIRVPRFAVATVADHVAPWRSVYKAHLVPDELSFVLTSGGHNAGIVSEPGHPGRTYQIRARDLGELYVDPDTWLAETPVRQGSWWPEWQSWLARHSSEKKVAPPPMGAPEKGYGPRRDAPGLYVREP